MVFGRAGAGMSVMGMGSRVGADPGHGAGEGRPEKGGRCRSGTDAWNVDELRIDEGVFIRLKLNHE